MIAPATPADLDAIDEIEQHSFPNPWPRETFAAELSRAGAHLVVERDERGRVAGFCNYHIVLDELHVHAVETHPERRRAGIGGRLIAHALDAGRALG
jgi:[ribosomal protein S18]-alanine N-acetyltransferase